MKTDASDLDLDRLHELERDLLDRLGHPACCSGYDVRWTMEDRLFLEAEPHPGGR